MKTIKFLIFFTAILSFIFINGCKKKDNPQPNDNVRAFQVETITEPDAMAQSSDPGAQMASGYINMANGMSAFGAMMVPPKSTPARHYKNSNDNNPEIHTWKIDDGENNIYNVTLTITETSELYKWEMKVDGLVDGHQMDNFIFIKAEQYKDGHDNTLTIYDQEKPLTASFIFKWHKTNDVAYLTFEEPQSIYLSYVVNPDNSGSVDAKEWTEDQEYQTTYTASWDSTGHGEYWEYEGGEVTNHGTW